MSRAGDWVAANAARPRWKPDTSSTRFSARVGDDGALRLDEAGGMSLCLPAHEALALAYWIIEVFK